MLGCQDFCGYYDWTFHYVGRRFGPHAVRSLWEQAIGNESQAHYAEAGREGGLRGLYETWTKTGEDEHCDWTFTLDEERNALRWDMRECPSKGFLLKNDLNSCEDYCDHCMGWMVPLLQKIGVEVAAHEHNHCGQCWGEMRIKGRSYETLQVDQDIRRDPRWQRGYTEQWQRGVKLPLLEDAAGPSDPCEVLVRWFSGADRLIIVDSFEGARNIGQVATGMLMMTDTAYLAAAIDGTNPRAVLIAHTPRNLRLLAERFEATPASQRPLLMYAFLPSIQPPEFVAYGLPRPVPILPLLIREARYQHRPSGPLPCEHDLLIALATALHKPFEALR